MEDDARGNAEELDSEVLDLAQGDDEGPDTDDEGPKVFASEDDSPGRPKGREAPAEPAPAEAIESRLIEKERQAIGLTHALRQEREARRILEGRLGQLLERIVAAQAPKEEQQQDSAPDPETDAVGAIRHDLKKLGETIASQREEAEQREAEKEIDAGVGGTIGWVQQDAVAFAEQRPDYPQAAAYMEERIYQGIASRLRFENPGVDPDTIAAGAEQIFYRDLANLHHRYSRSGRSFAATVYEAALQNGWSPQQLEEAREPKPARRQDPVIEAARRRVSHSRTSLGSVGAAAAPRRQITRSQLVNMPDDQFAALLESGGFDFRELAEHFGVHE